MKCLICNKNSSRIFSALVLNKHSVNYFKCVSCEFIQTEKPYWLKESYQSAITDLDVGLVNRNIEYSKIIFQLLTNYFDYNGNFLDYAGGYGMFTRLMRDNGLNFFHHDKYCDNIFAQNLELKTIKNSAKIEAITALEVFEHLPKPLIEIEKMLTISDSIIFSTELVPEYEITNADSWWYFTPQTGQHISFYSKATLLNIANKFKLQFYTNNSYLHILSKKKFSSNPFTKTTIEYILPSLTQEDFEYTKFLMGKRLTKHQDVIQTRNNFIKHKSDNDVRTEVIAVPKFKLSSNEAKLIKLIRKLKISSN